jgi:hypothetical protein
MLMRWPSRFCLISGIEGWEPYPGTAASCSNRHVALTLTYERPLPMKGLAVLGAVQS